MQCIQCTSPAPTIAATVSSAALIQQFAVLLFASSPPALTPSSGHRSELLAFTSSRLSIIDQFSSAQE